MLAHRFSVVLISNQNLKPLGLADWKKKIPLIAAAVRIPHRIVCCCCLLTLALDISILLDP
jgi:hypothetical protein